MYSVFQHARFRQLKYSSLNGFLSRESTEVKQVIVPHPAREYSYPQSCRRVVVGGMEELEGKWDRLHLLEEENLVIEMGDSVTKVVEDKGDRSLVGRVLAERSVGKGVIGFTMAKVWRVISRPATF